MGALCGPIDPLRRRGGRRDSYGVAVLGLPGLVLEQHVFIAGFLAGFLCPTPYPDAY